jgi:hypothetical protein
MISEPAPKMVSSAAVIRGARHQGSVRNVRSAI